MTAPNVLEVDDLYICTRRQRRPIVDHVSLNLQRGYVLGLVGESGSGKTTTALATLGHVRRGLRVESGRVAVAGVEMIGATAQTLQTMRRSSVGYVPQDPFSALTPTMRIGRQLADAIRTGAEDRDDAVSDRSRELLDEVGLPGDAKFLHRYPHQLSGGQRQRLTIAIAFANRPQLVVLDEPTTGLDVTTQRLVLNTISRLCADHGVAAVYVSHDLAVVHSLAQTVAVMCGGRLVELGPVSQVLLAPQHSYTKALVEAVPSISTSTSSQHVNATTSGVMTARIEEARYGATTVLRDIHLVVQEGECLAVVGESGSGKTTLARCLAGLHDGYDGYGPASRRGAGEGRGRPVGR